MDRDAIMRAADPAKWGGIPYRLPPDPEGEDSIDCSLYVLMVYENAGQPFPPGIRTAEQIRRVSVPINDADVLPGDLIFFQNTYPTAGASHVGISLGSGSGTMIDAHERSNDPDAVAKTNVRTQYWLDHWMEARRFDRAVAPVPTPTPTPGLQRMRVDATGLNVRDAPTISGRVLGTLREGTIVQAKPHAWRWVEVGALKGWSADEFLEDA